MKAASRSFHPSEKCDLAQNLSLPRDWTEAEGHVFRLDEKFARSDIGLTLVESLFVMTEGRRLRFCTLSARPLRKERLPVDSSSELRDGWRVLFEYHRLSAQNEIICLSTGGSVVISDGAMIGFDMNVQLSREYCHKRRLSLRLGRASVTLVPVGCQEEDCIMDNASGPYATLSSKECEPFARSASWPSLDRIAGESGPEEIFVYDLDNDGWIAPKDALFELLSPTLAVSEQDVMLFRFGAAGFGEIRFCDAPMCAG